MGSLISIIGDSFIIIDSRNANEKRMKPIAQYNREGEEIARFSSIAEAQRVTNIYHIYECVNGKRKTAGGYIWRIIQGESNE